MTLTPEQRDALGDARLVLAQEKDSAAPCTVRLDLLRAALVNLVAKLEDGAP